MKTFLINVFLFVTKIALCTLLPEMYKRNVNKDSIIKKVNVTSITECIFQCMDVTDCIAVGFIPSHLKSFKNRFALCHMIKEQTGEKSIILEVFVSI